MIFGRTDLRIGGSKAKFDVEGAGDVHLVVAPPKSHQINEKLIFRSENFAEKNFLASKNETSGIVRNAFSPSLAAVRALFEG